MKQGWKTGVKYTLFALISTGCNLGTQRLSFAVYDEKWAIYVALMMGTGVGLLVKYILDKLFIFYYKTTHIKEDIGRFILYSVMGIITTIIFWGTELLFNAIFHFEQAKYIGGAVGLAIGYTTKYFLDKHFVFVKNENKADI